MGNTCFLYLDHLDNETCLSVKLDQQGQILADPKPRLFSEIKELQQNSQTIVVLPADNFNFQDLELPWLAEKKARAAIPFALEDKLSANVEELHFAFSRQYYQNGHYLVAICKKHYLAEMINKLTEHSISFNAITVDWFALEPNEMALLNSYILVNEPGYKGALSAEIIPYYPQLKTTQSTLYTFNESNNDLLKSQANHYQPESVYVWIAKRLLQHPFLNLCQAEFTHGKNKHELKGWYIAAGFMAGIWLITVIALNGFLLHRLTQETTAIDAQIATIYRQFFPEAKVVISPRFRIEQLLKSQGNIKDDALWPLLNQLTQATHDNKDITVEQLRYTNQLLQVTLRAKDFTTLEKLENLLQKSNIKVKQNEAFTRENYVLGTLELSL